MDVCPKCGSNDIDSYSFPLPKELPTPFLLFIQHDVKENIVRLLSSYATIRIYICRQCGYSEIGFLKRR